MANRNYSMQDIARVARMLMGQGAPNPYMGLDLRSKWDNFAQRYLPQAPGMQDIMFQQWYPDESKAKYDLMMNYYNY